MHCEGIHCCFTGIVSKGFNPSSPAGVVCSVSDPSQLVHNRPADFCGSVAANVESGQSTFGMELTFFLPRVMKER